MAFGFVLGGVLFLCAATCALLDAKRFQQSTTLPQVPIEVQCKAHYLSISLAIPPSGSEPRFEAIDATGVYPITESYGAQCGYTYSVQPLLGRVILRASYFSCHTDNQNDEVFSFMFGVIIVAQSGGELFFNVSETCSVLPFSPREVICEENYMEVSVKTDLPCSTSGSVKDFSAAFSVARSSAVETWQVMLQQGGQLSEVMSTEDAAALGYFITATPGRLVFRTTFGQPYASVKMVSGVAIEVVEATVFFRQNWMVVMVDLVVACSLDKGSFDGYRLHWRTPAVMTPLALQSALRSQYISIGVDGVLLDEQASVNRGYSLTASGDAIDSSIPIAAEGAIRKSFVTDGVYNELYTAQLTYQQSFVDQRGVETKYNVVRQIATPPIPRLPFSINQTNPEERVFTVYLGNIPFDVELVAIELNGQEISVLTAMQMGFSIIRVQEEGSDITFAYILRVPFEDQFVVKQYTTEGLFEYSLEIKWTLNITSQMESYYHFSSVTAFVQDILPFVFDSLCANNGIRFMKDHHVYDYLWDVVIGQYPLTQQLASERGYIMTNDSISLTLDVPLFTIGYIYENITLQQFLGTFELLTRNAKTLEIKQSSAKSCLFETTELLVCSSEGVMTVVSDITKAVPAANPARTTLLDPSCRPQETDETRVLFSFGLNTCGTRFQIDQQYVTYENEIIFHELYSTDSKPVITRDAAYRMTVRCIYPVSGIENLFVDRKLRMGTPGIGQIKDPVKVPPQMPMQLQKQTVMKPSYQAVVAKKPADYVHVGQWSSPADKRAWSLGPNGNF
ncbi:zona pellucida protein AX 4 [Chanodichthys erythropterus]|uniref:zona pellucida protein AX 4 n=1 Tax=Chanodichthys erythropterus TaxID=933992 RepID=UPI00351DD288